MKVVSQETFEKLIEPLNKSNLHVVPNNSVASFG